MTPCNVCNFSESTSLTPSWLTRMVCVCTYMYIRICKALIVRWFKSFLHILNCVLLYIETFEYTPLELLPNQPSDQSLVLPRGTEQLSFDDLG